MRSKHAELSSQDPFHLERFVLAQAPVFDRVLSELRAGQKTSHWMWFVFPQIRGLGRSRIAMEFAISSRAEAQSYLQHPILGPRLKECTRLVLEIKTRSAAEIFGSPDDMKFRSAMTLFAQVSEDNIFQASLQKYYGGQPDPLTLDLL